MEPTPEQIANRSAAVANGGTLPEGTEKTSSTSNSDFMQQLQNRLLAQSDIISSENTNLENKISEAISGVKTGAEASAKRIESQFGREIEATREEAQRARQTFQEGQRGFAQNTAALHQLDAATDKELKDLEQRKQELLLAGEAQAASTISGLQIQAIQFRQQARAQAFSQILQMGQFAQQQQSLEAQIQAQTKSQSIAEAQLTLQEKQLELQKSNSVQDRLLKQQEINLRKREIGLKEVEQNTNADILRLNAVSSMGTLATNGLKTISADLENGLIDEQEAIERQLKLATRLQSQYKEFDISIEDTLEAVGLPSAETAEESRNQAIAALPGEVESDGGTFDIFTLLGGVRKGVGKAQEAVGNFFGAERLRNRLGVSDFNNPLAR